MPLTARLTSFVGNDNFVFTLFKSIVICVLVNSKIKGVLVFIYLFCNVKEYQYINAYNIIYLYLYIYYISRR